MKRFAANLFFLLLALAGAGAYATLAVRRAEPVNSAYILIAAVCTYVIGYRFYSKWIAARVLMLNDRRATPCEVHDDGKDFCRTNKWVVFGHHFAAISGPGPLVGPVLAAQFGYLPGTLWILIGVVLGGAVQDFVILFCSMRRNGKSLGQMMKEELNSAAGAIALIAILTILIILLAVLGLVVVNALAESPWGVFTVAATVPIAMFMGGYMRFWRIGKVMEASAIGVVLLLLAVWGGKFAHENATVAHALTFKPMTLAWAIIGYGLAASILPVWLLLAPRDYLSTFMKLGTIFALALGIFLLLPDLKMHALTEFASTGAGLVFAGKVFPFCFITIACGAISGFHSLISSGTTPKIITRESYARSVGYGAMCLESLVAIMALIAACTLDPGVYMSMNVKGDAAATAAKVSALGPAFQVTVAQMNELAAKIGEHTLFGRVGGAPTLAVGMAHIFSNVVGGRGLDLWYHFAIMFEALFILTTIDAGTRVGRYLLQDLLGHMWKPLGETRRSSANIFASALLVSAWGYFLVQGVRDPLGGINSLWPLFGIANQMLAAIALCLAVTIILKMQIGAPSTNSARTETRERAEQVLGAPRRSPALALIAFIPLVWLLTVTMTAGVQKIWHPDPKIGFLSAAQAAKEKIDFYSQIGSTDLAKGNEQQYAELLNAAPAELKKYRALRFNNLLDAGVAGVFLILIAIVVLLSLREWILLLAGKRVAELRETPPTWLPDYAIAEAKPLNVASLIGLAFLLVKELSGEARIDRAREQACACAHEHNEAQTYVQATEHRFNGINRCC